jgi:3',5'-cyclic-AMP phosphodiesterase
MLIAQLSDIHVRPHGQLYKNVVDSNAMLLDAFAHLHALDRRPDLVLISGDLVDEGQPDEYAELRRLLSGLTLPYVVLPGNHDQRDALRAAFADHRYLPAAGPLHFCIDEHAVRIVALDSTVPGKHYGELDAAALAWLRGVLDAASHKPTLLFVHHPPFICGIPYLDEYRLLDPQPLAAAVSAYSSIEAVLCGHVPRSMVRRWAGTVVAACPSTTTEIALQLRADAQPQSFIGPPACLLHVWDPAHGLVSHTSYIGKYPGPYPFF